MCVCVCVCDTLPLDNPKTHSHLALPHITLSKYKMYMLLLLDIPRGMLWGLHWQLAMYVLKKYLC